MSRVSLCLFGSSPVRVDGRPHRLAISGATERLFQYLLIHAGREIRREYLADLFWRGTAPRRQRSAFNSASWRIKNQLAELPGLEIVSQGSTVALAVAPEVRIDAHELTDRVHEASNHAALDAETVGRLQNILEACDAPFMDGVTADWVLTERERLFNLSVRGWCILMHWLGRERRYEDALEVGRRLLAADPAREAAQCEVMWLYVLNGQRAQALRQYREYAAWLFEEIGIEPMPETRAVYEHIRLDLEGGSHRTPDQPRREPSRNRFDALLGAIERSRRELYEVLSSSMS
jgi:DNA-binding SARP family transcriptional activator